MKKRVVIDASSCLIGNWNPYLSGVGRTSLELIRALEAKKTLPFELVLFCQRFKKDRLQRYHFKSPQYCLPLPRNKWINWIKNTFPVVETLTGADLYHIPHNCGEFFNGRNTILTIHDAMMFETKEDHLYKQEFQKTLKKAAERCRAILTCSYSSKLLLLRHLDIPEEKITVAPWGYDSSIFKKLSEEYVKTKLERRFHISSPYLFSVSCDIGRKRTPELIHEYIKCAEKDIPFDLVLVWKKIPTEIAERIAASPAKEKIHIFSSVSDEELAILYNGSSCTVFPSIHEGFGLPILESMACGTPVLTTKETSLPEIAGDAGIYLPSLEEEEIGKQIMNLAEGKFNLKDYARKSLQQAEKFSWSRCAEITISVYEKNLL